MGARDDEREALRGVIERGWRDPAWDGLPIERKLAAAVIAAGYRKHPEPEVTDAMVERAAHKMFEPDGPGGEYTWAEMVREDPTRADLWRADASAVLEAAFRVPVGDSVSGEGEQ